MSARRHAGIEPRHRSGCPAGNGGRCKCKPAYRAEVYSATEKKRIRKTFPTFAAAKGWRDDHLAADKRKAMRADPGPTIGEAAEDWLAGVKDGSILTRSGSAYKPSALRGYEQALNARVLPDLGGSRLREVTRADLQQFVARVSKAKPGEAKPSPSVVRNTLLPVRAIYRHAVAIGTVEVNPTIGLSLPAANGKREKIVNRTEAAKLLDALPETERALWATALYAGLRRGELMALRWSDVDFSDDVIRVRRSWDVAEGEIDPKSLAGRRAVPLPKTLRAYLEPQDRSNASALVFGRDTDRPFNPRTISDRAERAWSKAKIDGLTLHDCRHTYASLMIDAGANPKALSTYMGHSTITITIDRYGHLMPGNEAEAAKRFDAYLENGAVLGQS